MIMLNDDEAYHCGDANINKVAEREVVIFFEVFHNHRDELEV